MVSSLSSAPIARTSATRTTRSSCSTNGSRYTVTASEPKGMMPNKMTKVNTGEVTIIASVVRVKRWIVVRCTPIVQWIIITKKESMPRVVVVIIIVVSAADVCGIITVLVLFICILRFFSVPWIVLVITFRSRGTNLGVASHQEEYGCEKNNYDCNVWWQVFIHGLTLTFVKRLTWHVVKSNINARPIKKSLSSSTRSKL